MGTTQPVSLAGSADTLRPPGLDVAIDDQTGVRAKVGTKASGSDVVVPRSFRLLDELEGGEEAARASSLRWGLAADDDIT